MTLGAISHPDLLVDQKVKYFYDCFHYWLNNSTKYVDGFPENHLSYLERMIMRVETLGKMHQSSRMAICSWLKQPEFNTKKDSFSTKAAVKPLVSRLKKLAEHQANNFDGEAFRETAYTLIKELNGPEGLNGSVYFHEVLNSQLSFMRCSHPLETHQEEIMQHSKWLVAEYLRLGFAAKDIEGYRGIFRQILRFNDLKTSKKPHSVGFPLPPELKQQQNSKQFKQALRKYVNTSTFNTQFEGMLHALRETQQATFFLRINGIKKYGDEPFKFSYGGATFIEYDELAKEQLKLKLNDVLLEDFETYFNAPNTIIAKVSLHFKSREQGLSKAKYIINGALNALRFLLNKQGGQVSTDRVIIVWSEGATVYQGNASQLVDIHSFQLQILNNIKQTIPAPENLSIETSSYIDRCRRIFFKGLASEDVDDKISYFWQYWETSFSFGKYKQLQGIRGNQLSRGELIINDLSLILAKGILRDARNRIGLIIYNYAMNNQNEKTGIPTSYYGREYDRQNPENSIREIKAYTNYPFLKMLIRRFEKLKEEKEEVHWQAFYKHILWQLYEQRNFIAHDGTYCPATLERLEFYYRTIVTRWEAKLFNAIEKVPGCSVEDAVERLVLESRLSS